MIFYGSKATIFIINTPRTKHNPRSTWRLRYCLTYVLFMATYLNGFHYLPCWEIIKSVKISEKSLFISIWYIRHIFTFFGCYGPCSTSNLFVGYEIEKSCVRMTSWEILHSIIVIIRKWTVYRHDTHSLKAPGRIYVVSFVEHTWI